MACNALMVQAWGFAPSIGGPTWSISTEFAAYLAFPALVAIVLARSASVGLAIGVVMAVLLMALARLDSQTLHQIADGIPSRSGPLDIFGTGTVYPLLRCAAGFVLGLVAFRLSSECLARRFIGWTHAGDLSAMLVLGLWAVRGTDVVLELAFLALVMTLGAGGSIAARLIGSGIVFWLGEVSYSIYLVHRPVESLLRNPLKALLEAHHAPHAFTISGVVPLILTFLVAAGSFYGLEKPARNWTRRLIGGYVPPISVEPSAP
jgi:peptidoglycan/LPS O-acetylase OafA/YrhL